MAKNKTVSMRLTEKENELIKQRRGSPSADTWCTVRQRSMDSPRTASNTCISTKQLYKTVPRSLPTNTTIRLQGSFTRR